MDRFIVQQWGSYPGVYGIFDCDTKKLIGNPIESIVDANIICEWFNSVKFGGDNIWIS